MDDNKMTSWEQWSDMEELINVHACLECAEKNGYTHQEAEMCDNGSLNCSCCPFIRS